MEIKIIKEKIFLSELDKMAQEFFIDMVKAVVDVERKIMSVGGEWHADAEAILLKEGSVQSNLWGINIYPAKTIADRIEFSSLINVRPSANNRSMEILDEKIRQRIAEIVNGLIK